MNTPQHIDDDVGEGKRGNLRWDPTDGSPGRWQCGDHGIHAGDAMEVEIAEGQWVSCRIESADSGRKLIACFGLEQLLDKAARPKEAFDSGLSLLSAKVNTHTVNLRWPRSRG